MRIVFTMYCFENLATTSAPFWLGRELAKQGHYVTLIALSKKHRFRSERRTQDGVHLLLTPRGITGRWHYDGWGPHDILTRLLHLLRRPYDVLVAFDCRANVYLPFRVLKGRVPLRIMIWGDRWGDGCLASGASRFGFQRRLEEKWERTMATQADGLVFTSPAFAAVAKSWNIPDSRICRIPHGSPTDLIQTVPKDLARKQMGLEGRQPVLGFMGHTLGELDSFFPTFERLVRRYPQMTVLCIGSCHLDGKAKVEKAGLSPYFRFTGFVPTAALVDWLGCADLFLMPMASHANNDYRYPGKLGDYMTAGRPIIAPDKGEAGRVIRREKIGVLVRQDLTDAEERIRELLEDQPLAEQLGMQARRAAEEKFAWPILTNRFEAFLSSLARANPQSCSTLTSSTLG